MFKIVPFLLLLLVGFITRVYLDFIYGYWVLGGGGASLEHLFPGYVSFTIAGIVLSIIIVKKYSFKSVRIYLLITWLIILTFTVYDIGNISMISLRH